MALFFCQLFMKIEATTLEGEHVRLEPLAPKHLNDLSSFAFDPDLWTVNSFSILNAEQLSAYIDARQKALLAGIELGFATIEKATQKAVGSTRFMNIAVNDKRVEIGGTFIGKPWQRTVVNTEAKYLMLRHAFEVWNCNRVELKTDRLNERSQTAILRIGAQLEGIMRSHMITWTGRVRDSVYFSVTSEEWPEVKEELERKLAG